MADERKNFAGTKVIQLPLDPVQKIAIVVGWALFGLLTVGIAYKLLDDIYRGRGEEGALVLLGFIACSGAFVFFLRRARRRNLSQLARINAETGLSAAANGGYGLVILPRVFGATPGGKINAYSTKQASGGPFTRIEVASAGDVTWIARWIAADVAANEVNCLGASAVGDNLYRVDLSGVISQPVVANFLIRLGRAMSSK